LTEHGFVNLVGLVAWLILAASAFASFRLGWRESIRLGLVWAGIFTPVFLVISMVMAR